jgi:hypothetical protein
MGHSLHVGAACASLSVGASLMQIMHYGLWKSLVTVQRYLEHFDSISPDTSVWLFFDWMIPPLPPPRTHDDPVVQQVPLLSLSPLIDLDDVVHCSRVMTNIITHLSTVIASF